VRLLENDGLGAVFIITSKVAGSAHKPAVGVKVYVLVPSVLVFIDAGLHAPEMEFVLVVGKLGAVVFWQRAGIDAKVGVKVGLTVTFREVGEAHCPGSGVKE
jgi:hypothetical protein